MVGFIDNRQYFEFMNIETLEKSLSSYMNKCNSNYMIITDNINLIKGVLVKDRFTIIPENLQENKPYYLLLYDTRPDISLERNEEVANYKDDKHTFQYTIQTMPKNLPNIAI